MPVLDLAYHHLSPADLEETFQTGTFQYGDGTPSYAISSRLWKQTYCGSIGAEYMHIVDAASSCGCNSGWRARAADRVTRRAETVDPRAPDRSGGSGKVSARALSRHQAVRAGRWESLIPMLHELLQRLGSHGVIESVIGWRTGRLNVLVNVLGKDPADLFDEFDGQRRRCDAARATSSITRAFRPTS